MKYAPTLTIDEVRRRAFAEGDTDTVDIIDRCRAEIDTPSALTDALSRAIEYAAVKLDAAPMLDYTAQKKLALLLRAAPGRRRLPHWMHDIDQLFATKEN